MENGKIIEQLRLSKCSMEQLEVQVQSLVSNVEEQKTSTRETQVKLIRELMHQNILILMMIAFNSEKAFTC